MGRGFIFSVAVLVMPITSAQAAPDVYEDVMAYNAKAEKAYAQGDYYAARGENDNACYFYKEAASEWHNGMWAAVGISRDVYSDDTAIKVIDLLTANKQVADDSAHRVCGRPNDPSMASSASADVYVDYDPKDDVRLELQAMVKSGTKSGNAAYDLYEAGDYAGACAEAKLSATALSTASQTILNDPELNNSFANVEQLHIDARFIVEARDNIYCAR